MILFRSNYQSIKIMYLKFIFLVIYFQSNYQRIKIMYPKFTIYFNLSLNYFTFYYLLNIINIIHFFFICFQLNFLFIIFQNKYPILFIRYISRFLSFLDARDLLILLNLVRILINIILIIFYAIYK